MVKYTYKYRLYPSATQEVLLAKHFGCVRFVYNHFLARRIESYKNTKKSASCYDNIKELPQLKKELPWLKEVNSQSLQGSIEFLQKAYDNFFRRLKQKGVKPGFPTMKRRSDKQSFRVKQGVRVREDRLVIPKFLEGIPIVLHRELQGSIEFATIAKTHSGKYFVAITVTRDIPQIPQSNKIVALDLNVKHIVDDAGNRYENPLPASRLKKKLKKLHQDVSRCQLGSNEREKARIRLARCLEYCHNVRDDFQHKLSKQIICENQTIIIEDLNVESMMSRNSNEPKWKQKQLKRSLSDCAFGEFLFKLKYKAGWYGREFVKVDRWFPSSQLCSECGYQFYELPKNCKGWSCPECNASHDRDHNAARNLLVEGIRITTAGTAGFA